MLLDTLSLCTQQLHGPLCPSMLPQLRVTRLCKCVIRLCKCLTGVQLLQGGQVSGRGVTQWQTINLRCPHSPQLLDSSATLRT